MSQRSDRANHGSQTNTQGSARHSPTGPNTQGSTQLNSTGGNDSGRASALSSGARKNTCFAMRPTASSYAAKSDWKAPVALKANSYRLKMQKGFDVNKYCMAFTPAIPDNSKVAFKVTKACREQIKQKFPNYMLHGNNLYSTNLYQDPLLFNGEYDGQEYQIEVKFTKNVNNDKEEFDAFQSILFKGILGRLNFERDGRNMFNPAKAVNIQNLDIWPGFFSSMQNLAAGPFI